MITAARDGGTNGRTHVWIDDREAAGKESRVCV